MKSEDYESLLQQGVEVWNRWRKIHLGETPDLSYKYLKNSAWVGANFRQVIFFGTNISNSDCSGCDCSEACFDTTILENICFKNAVLSEANFYKANLKKADLTGATLIGANLKEATLEGAELERANLSRAYLFGASFKNANLSNANFKDTQARGTDFEGATLTGACIEDWNINGETNLKNIICDYIYYKEGQLERRPSDLKQIFAPGDFARLVQKALEAVDLIFRDGIEWIAFLEAFQQLQNEVQSAELAIQAIERKPGGIFVIRVEVPREASKAEIEKYLKQEYELRLQAIEVAYQKQLRAKDAELKYKYEQVIAAHREQSTSLLEMAKIMANTQQSPIYIQTTNMANSESKGDTYNQQQVGIGHMSGGEIKDNVKAAGIYNEAKPEILQLVESLRQNFQALNEQNIRHEADEYLSDIEAELEQPEPKQSRLKASVQALWNLGKDVTLVANGITALAERFGISLPHLPPS